MPKITRTLIHLFVVLLGVAFLAGFAQAEKEQKPEESLGSSLSSSLWQTQQNYLQEAEASLKEIEQKIPKLGGQIDEQVDEYSKIIKQMLRIRGLVKKDFRNYLIIKTNFERVRQGLKTELDPLDKMLLRLKDLQEGLKAQESEYKAQQKLTPYFRNYGSQATLDRILRDIKKVNQLSSDLLSIKKPVEHLLNQLENFNKEISAEIETSWKIYFFQPQKWYYKLLQLKNSWQDWKSSLPFYAHFFLMGSPDWKILIAYSSTFFVFYILISILAGVWLKRRIEQIDASRFFSGLVFLSLAFGIWSGYAILNPLFQSVLLQLIGQLFFFWGLLKILWAIRYPLLADEEQDQEIYNNPLRCLFFLFAFSMILQSFNPPDPILVLLWVFSLVTATLWLRKRKVYINEALEKNIYLISMFLLPLLALLSLMGWFSLGLIVICLWFVLSTSFQLGAIATRLLFKKVKTLPDSDWGILGQGIVQGTGIPVLWILALGMVLLWLGFTFEDFGFMSELSKLKLGWGKISFNFFKLLIVVVAFYFARSCLTIAVSFLKKFAGSKGQVDPGTVASLQTLISYAVWGIYIIAALAFLGFSLTSLTVVAGGLSVGIGFGLQSIVNNFISGLILLFGRSIQPGDIIQLEDLWAEVKEVNIRTTEVETFDRSSILLPNSQLISEQITNWTHKDRILRRRVTVGVAYGSDVELVKRLLLHIAETNTKVLRQPAPFVRFAEFGSSSLDFTLYFYSFIEHGWMAESDLRMEIDKVFKMYKIEIAFPQRDLHVKSFKGLEKLFDKQEE